jgi:hypothetical protein
MHQVGEADSSLNHRHGDSNAEHVSVLQVTSEENSHQFLGRIIIWHSGCDVAERFANHPAGQLIFVQ